jgi:hypothetical protein
MLGLQPYLQFETGRNTLTYYSSGVNYTKKKFYSLQPMGGIHQTFYELLTINVCVWVPYFVSEAVLLS